MKSTCILVTLVLPLVGFSSQTALAQSETYSVGISAGELILLHADPWTPIGINAEFGDRSGIGKGRNIYLISVREGDRFPWSKPKGKGDAAWIQSLPGTKQKLQGDGKWISLSGASEGNAWYFVTTDYSKGAQIQYRYLVDRKTGKRNSSSFGASDGEMHVLHKDGSNAAEIRVHAGDQKTGPGMWLAIQRKGASGPPQKPQSHNAKQWQDSILGSGAKIAYLHHNHRLRLRSQRFDFYIYTDKSAGMAVKVDHIFGEKVLKQD
ncbi:MAG: hypothetical protein DWQ01_15935 [Planctomycetota bacterium]|nr:MAG: hypothetical protein DWQ01_15935 [Planctomycetota bacterium]